MQPGGKTARNRRCLLVYGEASGWKIFATLRSGSSRYATENRTYSVDEIDAVVFRRNERLQKGNSRRVQRASLDDVASGALCAAEENAIASYAKVVRYERGNVRENGTSGRERRINLVWNNTEQSWGRWWPEWRLFLMKVTLGIKIESTRKLERSSRTRQKRRILVTETEVRFLVLETWRGLAGVRRGHRKKFKWTRIFFASRRNLYELSPPVTWAKLSVASR